MRLQIHERGYLMKTMLIVIFMIEAITSNSQYVGGIGSGNTQQEFYAHGLGGNDYSFLFLGNIGSGDAQENSFAINLTGDNLNLIFTGGPGRGEHSNDEKSLGLGGQDF